MGLLYVGVQNTYCGAPDNSSMIVDGHLQRERGIFIVNNLLPLDLVNVDLRCRR